MKALYLCLLVLVVSHCASGEVQQTRDSPAPPPTPVADVNPFTCKASEYYADIDFNSQDDELKSSLSALINSHVVFSYNDIWTAFAAIDQNLPNYPCNSNLTHMPDVYSSYCWTQAKTGYGGDNPQCGQYKQEGDCFNREHLWPKSWFGGFSSGEGAQTDLFELWPADGYVNGLRGEMPLGYVNYPTYVSSNGCKIGPCSSKGSRRRGAGVDPPDVKCFEPSDEFKGQFARSYFYLSTCYMDKWSCCDTDGTDKSSIKPWMEEILKEWHNEFTVDPGEIAKNDLICNEWQGNRNPFVDHPEWVNQISDF